MKELVFALQFKGKAHPVEGVEGKLAAKTTAAGQILRTAQGGFEKPWTPTTGRSRSYSGRVVSQAPVALRAQRTQSAA